MNEKPVLQSRTGKLSTYHRDRSKLNRKKLHDEDPGEIQPAPKAKMFFAKVFFYCILSAYLFYVFLQRHHCLIVTLAASPDFPWSSTFSYQSISGIFSKWGCTIKQESWYFEANAPELQKPQWRCHLEKLRPGPASRVIQSNSESIQKLGRAEKTFLSSACDSMPVLQ